MVGSKRSILFVTNKNIVRGGGSSSIFSNEFAAAVFNASAGYSVMTRMPERCVEIFMKSDKARTWSILISFDGALVDLAFLPSPPSAVLTFSTFALIQNFRTHATVIRMTVLREPTAGVTFTASMPICSRRFAQQRLRARFGKCRLAYAFRAVKQNRVRQPLSQQLPLLPGCTLPWEKSIQRSNPAMMSRN